MKGITNQKSINWFSLLLWSKSNLAIQSSSSNCQILPGFAFLLFTCCLLTVMPKVRNWVNSNFEVRTKLFKKIIIFKKEVYTRVILFNLINYHPSTKDGHKLNLKKIPHINKIKRKLALKFMCQYSVVVALLQKRKAWVPYDQNNNVPKARQKWFYVFICLLPFLISEDWSLIAIRVISTSSKSF